MSTDKEEISFGSKLYVYNRILAVVIVFQVVANKYADRLPLAAAPEKIFPTFDDFYPFYLSQHADETCQRLHIIGTSTIIAISLMSGSPFNFVTCMIPAMFAGCAMCVLTASVSNGIPEAIVLICTYLATVRAALGKSKLWAALFVILIGYGFAWVGHFHFEMNRPATFIYPTYSLMGDFKMWFEVVSNVRPF